MLLSFLGKQDIEELIISLQTTDMPEGGMVFRTYICVALDHSQWNKLRFWCIILSLYKTCQLLPLYIVLRNG
jgi:hypothetical protein